MDVNDIEKAAGPAAVKTKLSEAGVHADQVSRHKDGGFIARKGFFYRHGGSSKALADRVAAAGFKVHDHGEHYASFRGGASVAHQSHWWVHFDHPEAKPEEAVTAQTQPMPTAPAMEKWVTQGDKSFGSEEEAKAHAQTLSKDPNVTHVATHKVGDKWSVVHRRNTEEKDIGMEKTGANDPEAIHAHLHQAWLAGKTKSVPRLMRGPYTGKPVVVLDHPDGSSGSVDSMQDATGFLAREERTRTFAGQEKDMNMEKGELGAVFADRVATARRKLTSHKTWAAQMGVEADELGEIEHHLGEADKHFKARRTNVAHTHLTAAEGGLDSFGEGRRMHTQEGLGKGVEKDENLGAIFGLKQFAKKINKMWVDPAVKPLPPQGPLGEPEEDSSSEEKSARPFEVEKAGTDTCGHCGKSGDILGRGAPELHRCKHCGKLHHGGECASTALPDMLCRTCDSVPLGTVARKLSGDASKADKKVSETDSGQLGNSSYYLKACRDAAHAHGLAARVHSHAVATAPSESVAYHKRLASKHAAQAKNYGGARGITWGHT